MLTTNRHLSATTVTTTDRSRVAFAWNACGLVLTAGSYTVTEGHKPATGPGGTS